MTSPRSREKSEAGPASTLASTLPWSGRREGGQWGPGLLHLCFPVAAPKVREVAFCAWFPSPTTLIC